MIFLQLLCTIQLSIGGLFGPDGVSDFIPYAPAGQGKETIAFYLKGPQWARYTERIGLKKIVDHATSTDIQGNESKKEMETLKQAFRQKYDSYLQLTGSLIREAAVLVYMEQTSQAEQRDQISGYLVIANINMKWVPPAGDPAAKALSPFMEALKKMPEKKTATLMGKTLVRYGDIVVAGDPGSVSHFMRQKNARDKTDSGTLEHISDSIEDSAFYMYWSTDNPAGIYGFSKSLHADTSGSGQDSNEFKKQFLRQMNMHAGDGPPYTIDDADAVFKSVHTIEQRIDLQRDFTIHTTLKGKNTRYVPLLSKMMENRNYFDTWVPVWNRKYNFSLRPDDFRYTAHVDKDDTSFTLKNAITMYDSGMRSFLSTFISRQFQLHAIAATRRIMPAKKKETPDPNRIDDTGRYDLTLRRGWVNNDIYRTDTEGRSFSGTRNRAARREQAKQNAFTVVRKTILGDFRRQRMENPALREKSSREDIEKEFGDTVRQGELLKITYDDDGSCYMIYQVIEKNLKAKVTGR
ncbi:MAG TPA: hypothetical protein PK544_10720 [Spirochaetota bacterium]|nr:hypothetical protein [Spirochaetota bacterium]